MIPDFRFIAFKAVDNPMLCKKFIEGHREVLKIYGITEITTNNTDWFYNPGVYVIVVENTKTKEIVGGIRIQLASGNQHLPIEDAVKYMDGNIHNFVKNYEKNGGVGELCGLWNARSVAGMGIGSVFLMRAGVALASQLNTKQLLALCAEHTLQISKNVGFTIAHNLGENGTFYYPKSDLLATSVIGYVNDLSSAEPTAKERIENLIEQPCQKTEEKGPKRKLIIKYNLKLEL